MKTQVLESLRTKFPGVSDTILDRIANKIAKTVTKQEDITTSVEGVTFQSLLDSYGDYRATEAQHTAVVNYEKKHNLKDGKYIVVEEKKSDDPTEKDENPRPSDETPAWAKALIEQNRSLSERLKSIEGRTMVQSRKEKLNKIIERLPDYLRKPYERISLDGYKEEEFDEFLTTIEGEVTETTTSLNQKGSVFGTPLTTTEGGKVQEASDKEVSDVVSKMNI